MYIRGFFTTAILAILIGTLLPACDKPTPAPNPPPKLAGLRPITYFEDNCSRCHGPYGSFYGETFARKLSPAQLHKVVHEMAAGPGNAPIEGAELEAQVAYHRSLADGQPFVVLTELKEEYGQRTLFGEATPESQLELLTNSASQPIRLDGHNWSIPLPAQIDFGSLTIRARKGGSSTTLNLSRIHSHY